MPLKKSLIMKIKNYLSLTLLFAGPTLFAQSDVPDKAKDLVNGFGSGKYEISDYNTACYFSLTNNHSAAFAFLNKAIDEGFDNSKLLVEDTDLESLHSDSLWQKIVDKVNRKKDNQEKSKIAFYNQKSFWDSPFFKTPYQSDISENEKVAGLSKFWSEAKYNFVNFDLVPDLNIDSLYFNYLPKVRQTTSTVEYYKTMMEFCGKLHDAHTNVMPPTEIAEMFYSRPLLKTRLIENKVLIVNVYDNVLGKQGIKVGQEVIEINGMPVKEYARKFVLPYQSYSTPQDANTRAYEYALLAGDIKEAINLKVSDEKSNVKEYTINRVPGAERSKVAALPAFEYKLLKGNIAYVALNSFGTDSAEMAFIKNYPEIAKASAIIFDVRNNGGGSTEWNIIRYLINKTSPPLHSWYTRDYKPSYRAWNHLQKVYGETDAILTPAVKNAYTGPVIVLTSSRTFSAAEDFAAAFKSLHRGSIIGQPTGGSTGQPLMISLPGNGSARICTKRDRLGNGEDFVGKGIQPDVFVEPTVSDVRKGVDTELEAALNTLQKSK